MKDRIVQFLKTENKSSAQFAEEIGVQPSGISHIISGRNNPSLDFIIKMLERYKFLSADWLLFGKGQMYKGTGGMPTLFDQENKIETEPIYADQGQNAQQKNYEGNKTISDVIEPPLPDKAGSIDRIIVFYTDKSFDEYFPRK